VTQRLENDGLVKRIYNWKPIATRMHGRQKNRREDDVMPDLRTHNAKNWINCIQDRKNGRT
jgi:trehalose-6-phosphate synthase